MRCFMHLHIDSQAKMQASALGVEKQCRRQARSKFRDSKRLISGPGGVPGPALSQVPVHPEAAAKWPQLASQEGCLGREL